LDDVHGEIQRKYWGRDGVASLAYLQKVHALSRVLYGQGCPSGPS
jgi:hypothetical protein